MIICTLKLYTCIIKFEIKNFWNLLKTHSSKIIITNREKYNKDIYIFHYIFIFYYFIISIIYIYYILYYLFLLLHLFLFLLLSLYLLFLLRFGKMFAHFVPRQTLSRKRLYGKFGTYVAYNMDSAEMIGVCSLWGVDETPKRLLHLAFSWCCVQAPTKHLLEMNSLISDSRKCPCSSRRVAWHEMLTMTKKYQDWSISHHECSDASDSRVIPVIVNVHSALCRFSPVTDDQLITWRAIFFQRRIREPNRALYLRLVDTDFVKY